MTVDEHQRLREQLPWYANGTLAQAEAAPLPERPVGCAACRAELAHCRWLADGLQARDPPSWAPSAAGFARLMAAVNDAGRRAVPAQGAASLERLHGLLGERLRSGLGGSPLPVRWALAAQAALIVVLGAAWVAQASPPQYGTL
jgi:hypothetical protein